MSLRSVMNRGAKRAVYDFLSGNEPVGILDYMERVGTTKKVYRDKNGCRYMGQRACRFGNKVLEVWRADTRYVYTSDNKRHLITSVTFI